jgi:hypothetical protein
VYQYVDRSQLLVPVVQSIGLVQVSVVGDLPVKSTGFRYCSILAILRRFVAAFHSHKFTAPVPMATGVLVALFFHCQLLAVDSLSIDVSLLDGSRQS